MNVGSLFSGIGGFDLGFERTGMKVVWQVENDPFCNKVLAKHWPDVQRFGDIKDCGKHNLESVDLICGGFPCQDLSVAGKRAGLDGERSGLWFEFLRIIQELSPQWVFIENVPGLLSSDEGSDFAIILSGLAQCGYHASWRVLDSQYFRVPQRRRRVFIVGSLGNGSCSEILFESSCGCWDSPPSRETGKGVAGTIGGGSTESRRGYRTDLDTQGAYVIKGAAIGRKPAAGPQRGEILTDGSCYTLQTNEIHVVGTLAPNSGPRGHDAGNFHCNQAVDAGYIIPALAFNWQSGGDCRQSPMEEMAHPLQANQTQAVGLQVQWTSGGGKVLNDTAQSLRSEAEHNYQFIQTPMSVRRLTPTECLRLQGFPDSWLDIIPKLSDATKYRMVGNAVTVSVIRWIAKRILAYEATENLRQDR